MKDDLFTDFNQSKKKNLLSYFLVLLVDLSAK